MFLSIMLTDKNITDLRKLSYKYQNADIKEFISLLKDNGFYKELPLIDTNGQPVVYLDGITRVCFNDTKKLLTPHDGNQSLGLKAMEDEIASTFKIEQIDTSRASVRKILSGLAPCDKSEERVYAMKKGLEFIADASHGITEENVRYLYQIVIDDFLPQEDKLLTDQLYRNDSVFVVSGKAEHTGLSWKKLPEAMKQLIAYINTSTNQDDLIKSALIHFYFAWLHPYFDGNGRMARLLQLWYLVQCGYSSAFFFCLFQNKLNKVVTNIMKLIHLQKKIYR